MNFGPSVGPTSNEEGGNPCPRATDRDPRRWKALALLCLASGLNNAAFQIGGALGAAVVTRVAVSQTDGGSLAAPTHGFQSAFAAAAAFAAIGVSRRSCCSAGRGGRRPGEALA